SRIGTNYTNINKNIREIRLISVIRDKLFFLDQKLLP
ncbi:MAG: hypothetical protein QG641_2223, partial [Candidatus Poribacteria bacterium]|nr:hypothetical protein [Candidatus Poribacteria bacterium]